MFVPSWLDFPRMKRSTLGAVITVAVLAVATTAVAQVATDSGPRFELFGFCNPMATRIQARFREDVDPNNHWVAVDRVHNLVESRLRAARLYLAPDSYFAGLDIHDRLSIHFLFNGRAVFVELSYEKHLDDPSSGERALVSTWTLRSLGLHNRDGNSLMQTLSEMVDRFVLEFLRVNDEDCRRRNP